MNFGFKRQLKQQQRLPIINLRQVPSLSEIHDQKTGLPYTQYKLKLENNKYIQFLPSFIRCRNSRMRQHFDIMCIYRLSTYPYLFSSIYISIYLYINFSACIYSIRTYMFIEIKIYTEIHPSICLSSNLFIY